MLQKGAKLFAKFFVFNIFLMEVFISPGFCAQNSAPETPDETVYRIPSQPLDLALKTFATTSGMQVLYETELTAGRRSAPVIGSLEAGAALRILLTGSGLVGIRTDVDAFSIAMPQTQPIDEALEPDTRFLGALQTGILESLCRTPMTVPGTYRVALQLWLTPAGTIHRAELLGTSGVPLRDRAIALALQDVSISLRPSDRTRQPITLVIEPRPGSAGNECSDR